MWSTQSNVVADSANSHIATTALLLAALRNITFDISSCYTDIKVYHVYSSLYVYVGIIYILHGGILRVGLERSSMRLTIR